MSFQVDDGRIISGDMTEVADTLIRARNAIGAADERFERFEDGYGPKMYAWRDSAKSVNSSTWYAIEYDAEDYDTNGFHDNSTNPEDIIIPVDGRYLLIAQVQWAINSTGDRLLAISVNDGGTYGAGTQIAIDQRTALSARSTSLHVSTIYNFYKGDVIHVWTEQLSGGSLALNISGATPGSQNYVVVSRLGDIQD